MAFEGYLLVVNGNTIPLKYMKYNTYKATPNQRFDLDSTRDAAGGLHRTVLEHTATKIEFETPPMTNVDVSALNALLCIADNNERKVEVSYYDSEGDCYKTGTFYIPDVNYTIINIDAAKGIVLYDKIRYALIEY